MTEERWKSHNSTHRLRKDTTVEPIEASMVLSHVSMFLRQDP